MNGTLLNCERELCELYETLTSRGYHPILTLLFFAVFPIPTFFFFYCHFKQGQEVLNLACLVSLFCLLFFLFSKLWPRRTLTNQSWNKLVAFKGTLALSTPSLSSPLAPTPSPATNSNLWAVRVIVKLCTHATCSHMNQGQLLSS